ncbi:glycosyltransferase [Ancylobacter lacus]|uniref:glycosyltransferase n=1 Tax=Ancylobacter lacus TaxID=2579970 RepID=UPI001BCEDCB9|nr:glycosyltransferase [Ancylobacter lacus]MBS7539982.1 glycosyltransferase [Ancylobacter lacus]
MTSVTIAIPTKNRPLKLRKCLDVLAKIPEIDSYDVVVCDSSDKPGVAEEVAAVCRDFPFVRTAPHDGKNVAAARNACARAARGDVIVNVDDDIYLQPDAVRELIAAYDSYQGWRVVAGSVKWQDWSGPVKMRLIGYGRAVRPSEHPDFLIGAFFAYPRSLALAKPWNEQVRTSDDRFMGALWRSQKVTLGFAPKARAVHDEEHNTYRIDHQQSHIYVNLFDAVIANPSIGRAFCYEVLGFIWGLKAARREKGGIGKFVTAWRVGHQDLWRDRHALSQLVSTRLPPPGPTLANSQPTV